MRIIFLIFSIFLTMSLYAHSDTVLKLENGKLIGLPSKYSSASFDFEHLKLSISDKTVIFPNCIKPLFDFDTSDLLITSSWYHDTSREYSLPPYITVGHKNNYRTNILIDMDTLLPIAVKWGYGANELEVKCISEFVVHGT